VALAWPDVPWLGPRPCSQRTVAALEFDAAATVLACGAGDGNRTRAVSMGMETMPAGRTADRVRTAPI